MGLSVYPQTTLTAETIIAAAVDTLYEMEGPFLPGVYTISCISSTIATFDFFSNSSGLIVTGSTLSGTVNVNLATLANSIFLRINTGTNILITVDRTSDTISNTFSGILDTVTTTGTYTGTSSTGYAYTVVVGAGGRGGNGGTNGGGAGGAGGCAGKISALTGSMSVTIGAAPGGTTIFDGMTASGGGSGTNGLSAGAGGGGATGGFINNNGNGGTNGGSPNGGTGGSPVTPYSFVRTSAQIGTGGTGGGGGGGAGQAGQGRGSGGGGGGGGTGAGGAGAGGALYVLKIN